VYWLAETLGERLLNHVFSNRFLGSLQASRSPPHGLGVRIRISVEEGCIGWLRPRANGC
jgi:hypothetical protein